MEVDHVLINDTVSETSNQDSIDNPLSNENQELIGIQDKISQDLSNSKKSSTITDDDDDGSICPICLDSFTNSGEHRISSLKCGHIFCNKCVIRWLNSQEQKYCPTCKAKSKLSDIRYIYAKKLIALDNSELEALKDQLNLEIEEKNKMQIELSKAICREGILKQNICQLEQQIQKLSQLRQGQHNFKVAEQNISIVKLYMEKSLEICRQNGCRVFDFSNVLDLIVVSSKSPNNLFSGYCLRNVNITQYKTTAFLPIHNQPIRDICFNSMNNWVLTASMDKSFKVTDTVNNKILFTTSPSLPLWSCCWDSDNVNILYVGTQAGSILKYDIRSIQEPVCSLSIPGDMSPVVSVASISSAPGAEFPHGGVISCKLNSLWVFGNQGNDYLKHRLNLNGPFVSMKYNNETKQLLVSSRPNNLVPFSRHSLCTLSKNNVDVDCNIIHTFQGGSMQKLLSKSCFVSNQQDYVAAYEETKNCVLLWSINTGQKISSIPASCAVLDLKGIKTHNGSFLVSLTDRKMDFFKFLD